MSSVPFLRFPPSIQSEIVNAMDVRGMLKFSTCSRRIQKTVKSANYHLKELEVCHFENWLEVSICGTDCALTVLVSPPADRESLMEVKKGPEYRGFYDLRMYDYTEHSHGSVYKTTVVRVPDGLTCYETSDMVLGYLGGIFTDIENLMCIVVPVDPINRIIWKHFPKVDEMSVSPAVSSERERFMTKEEAGFMLEKFEVTRNLNLIGRIEEGFVYSKGFQAEWVDLLYPSWMHWDAIFNSTSRFINLRCVRTISSAVLNRILKLWVSNEKLQSLSSLTLCTESVPFPEGLLELILEGIAHEDVDLEIWPDLSPESLPFVRQISRVDGELASVEVQGVWIKINVHEDF